MVSDAPRCTGTRKDGQPCTAPALPSSAQQRCFAHDATAQAARVAGGKGRSTASRMAKFLPPELRDLVTRLQGWLDAVENGSLSAQQASALAALCTRLVDLAKLAHDLGQTAEIEARIAALEARER